MTNRVLEDIGQERHHQECKWGVQNHSDFAWAAILGKQVGQANEKSIYAHFNEGDPLAIRHELVQVAAVAIAWIECLDRMAAGEGFDHG